MVTVVLVGGMVGFPAAAAAEPLPVGASAVSPSDVDFNGDGYADLALGNIFALGDDGFEGAVHVMYGGAGGLSAKSSAYLMEDRLGGEGHRWDLFGGSLAAGDFDGDHFTDLAIGIMLGELDAPFGDEGSDHGMVRIVYGSQQGLTGSRSQLWSYGRMTSGEDRGHHFGSELAASNFGRSSHDDLAITAGFETVAVMYGSPTGIAASGYQLWNQDTPGIVGRKSFDQFGATMVTGHFAGRPYADLAIGAPGETVRGKPGAGAVTVIYGSASGLTAAGNQQWSQHSPGITGKAERDDGFGASLAAGRLNGTAFDALAVGSPCEAIRGRRCAGVVNVIYGSTAGLRAKGDQLWSQSSRGIPGRSERGDEFGGSLSIGNFGRNIGGRAFGDLAIGTGLEKVGKVGWAGAVTVIYGTASGLRSRHSRTVTQKTRGIPGAAGYQHMFGASLGAADVDRRTTQRFDELVVGVNEFGSDGAPASRAIVIQGAANGLNTTRCQIWSARRLGHLSTGDEESSFGEPILG